MKRALAVLFIGLGIVGISTLAGRRSANERYTAAQAAVDADCRAFRAATGHRHADVCRVDRYGPKAIPLYSEAKPLVEHARSALARGDTRAAENDIVRMVGILDEMEEVGTSIALIVRANLVKDILDLEAVHRELDATRLLRDVHLDVKHPFAVEALQHRWYLAHWNELPEERTRSTSNLADAFDTDTAAFKEMERAIVERHDVEECQKIARKAELGIGEAFCPKLENAWEISVRLDAVQHGRLSSAAR